MNIKFKNLVLVIAVAGVVTGCQTTKSGSANSAISYNGARPVVVNDIDDKKGYLTKRLGLGPMSSQVPSYDGKGLLTVSWTPTKTPFESPTYVIMHGGHGVGNVVWRTAMQLKIKHKANVLVLDSFWSRGVSQNRERNKEIDAIVRTFDAIAVGRWLKDQGTDPKKTYMMGGSQGGWTTLKAMTAEPVQIAEVKPLYAGGVAYYPVCDNYNINGNLRSGQRFITLAGKGYWGPVLLLTGDKDFATRIEECQQNVVKYATKHVRYERGTHGWNLRWREGNGLNKDGTCKSNSKYTMCYDEKHTNDMHDEIGKFTGVK
jgi:dienelactone hydrolase